MQGQGRVLSQLGILSSLRAEALFLIMPHFADGVNARLFRLGEDALFFHTPPRHRASTMAASCLLPLAFYLVVSWEPHAYTRLRLASGSVTGTRADTPTNKTGAEALFFHAPPRHRASTMGALRLFFGFCLGVLTLMPHRNDMKRKRRLRFPP